MVKKLKLNSNKKGYLQIDLMFALLLFFLIVFVAFSQFKIYTDMNSNNLDLVELDSDSRDICYLLISTNGYPINWEQNISTLNYIGLKSNLTNSLNNSKISVLNSTNYIEIIDKINASGYLKINIIGLNTSTNYLNFGNSGGVDSMFSKNICYSTYNNEIVKIVVEIWK